MTTTHNTSVQSFTQEQLDWLKAREASCGGCADAAALKSATGIQPFSDQAGPCLNASGQWNPRAFSIKPRK